MGQFKVSLSLNINRMYGKNDRRLRHKHRAFTEYVQYTLKSSARVVTIYIYIFEHQFMFLSAKVCMCVL